MAIFYSWSHAKAKEVSQNVQLVLGNHRGDDNRCHCDWPRFGGLDGRKVIIYLMASQPTPLTYPPGNKAWLRTCWPLVSLNKALWNPYFLGGYHQPDIPLIIPADTMYLQDHWTLKWKGLILYSRVWVLKIARFEGPGYLGYVVSSVGVMILTTIC